MSFEFLADPNAWVTLFTLSALEIVLGIDNLVFISIAVSKLPEEYWPAGVAGVSGTYGGQPVHGGRHGHLHP